MANKIEENMLVGGTDNSVNRRDVVELLEGIFFRNTRKEMEKKSPADYDDDLARRCRDRDYFATVLGKNNKK